MPVEGDQSFSHVGIENTRRDLKVFTMEIEERVERFIACLKFWQIAINRVFGPHHKLDKKWDRKLQADFC